MRKWLFIALFVGVGLATGCATVTRTPEENWNAQRQAAELGFRQITDDWNMIWMTDRQSRLTRWHVR